MMREDATAFALTNEKFTTYFVSFVICCLLKKCNLVSLFDLLLPSSLYLTHFHFMVIEQLGLFLDWLRGGRRTLSSGVQRSSEVMPTNNPRLTKQSSKESNDGSVSSEGSK